jgi:hypothetical protein
MATITPKLGLTKPAATDYYDVGVFNANSDLIDAAFSDLDGVLDDINGDLDGKQDIIDAPGLLKQLATGEIVAAEEGTDYAKPGLLVDGLTLPVSGWSGSGPYTKTFAVNGATTATNKRYDLVPAFSSTKATRDLEKTAWGLIDDARITAANTLTVTVTAVPVTAVAFSLIETVVKAVS